MFVGLGSHTFSKGCGEKGVQTNEEFLNVWSCSRLYNRSFFPWTTLSSPNDGISPTWTHFSRLAWELTSLLGKVLSNLNSSHGNPLDATKSKTICSLLLARKRRSRNSPLGVRIRSLLTGSASSSFGSGGRACSKESRIAYEGQKPGVRLCDGWDCGEWGERLEKSCCLLETHQKVIAHLLTKPNAWTVESYFSFS